LKDYDKLNTRKTKTNIYIEIRLAVAAFDSVQVWIGGNSTKTYPTMLCYIRLKIDLDRLPSCVAQSG